MQKAQSELAYELNSELNSELLLGGRTNATVSGDVSFDTDNFDDNNRLLVNNILVDSLLPKVNYSSDCSAEKLQTKNLQDEKQDEKVVDNQINNKHHCIQLAKESIKESLAKGIVANMPKGKSINTTTNANTATANTLDTAEKAQQETITQHELESKNLENKKLSSAKVFEPGIYDNIGIDEYHNSAGISSSGISLILDCPARYYYEYYIKDHTSTSKQQNEKYKIGRAVHMLTLEPEKFHSTFYCMDTHVNLTTKIGKEIYAQAELEANGRDIVRFFEWQEIKNMADAIKKHPVWKNLKDGKVEQSIFWKGGTFDTLLKSRPDFFNDKIIIDLKTTDCIKTFSNSIYSYGYHRQAAMQIDALKQLDGKERFFAFFVVEKKEPYLTACYTLDKESLIIGEKEYLDAAALYTECLMYNEWPGYANDFQLISIPKWALKNKFSEGAI